MDSATAFDATDGKSGRVSKAADNPSLPFERTLQCLVDFGGILEVDDVDVSVGGANNAEVVLDVQGVDSFLAGDGRRGTLLPEIPVLDSLVPRSRDNHRAVAAIEEATVPHGLVMCSNDNVLLRSEIADLDVLVGASRSDLCSVLVAAVS